MDLRFELTPGSLKLEVALAPGAPYQAAETRAGELRDDLQTAVEQTVSVAVKPRHDPLDVYA